MRHDELMIIILFILFIITTLSFVESLCETEDVIKISRLQHLSSKVEEPKIVERPKFKILTEPDMYYVDVMKNNGSDSEF